MEPYSCKKKEDVLKLNKYGERLTHEYTYRIQIDVLNWLKTQTKNNKFNNAVNILINFFERSDVFLEVLNNLEDEKKYRPKESIIQNLNGKIEEFKVDPEFIDYFDNFIKPLDQINEPYKPHSGPVKSVESLFESWKTDEDRQKEEEVRVTNNIKNHKFLGKYSIPENTSHPVQLPPLKDIDLTEIDWQFLLNESMNRLEKIQKINEASRIAEMDPNLGYGDRNNLIFKSDIDATKQFRFFKNIVDSLKLPPNRLSHAADLFEIDMEKRLDYKDWDYPIPSYPVKYRYSRLFPGVIEAFDEKKFKESVEREYRNLRGNARRYGPNSEQHQMFVKAIEQKVFVFRPFKKGNEMKNVTFDKFFLEGDKSE